MLHEINITGFSLFPLDSLSLQLHPFSFSLLNLLGSLISEYLLRHLRVKAVVSRFATFTDHRSPAGGWGAACRARIPLTLVFAVPI